MVRSRIGRAALLLVLAAVLMACAPQAVAPGGSAAGTQGTEVTQPSAAGGERPTIELLLTTGDQLPPDERNFIKQALDEALGIDLRLVGFAADDDLNTQLNVRMAGGNAPDLIRVNRATMNEYAQKGMLLDLTPYADQLEGVKSLVGEDALTKGMIGDTLYAIPRTPDPLYHTYWIRTDWLENLGLEMPTTLDELREVLVAFREQDPDGNGVKDTYGLTGQSLATFAPIFGAFGVTAPASAWGTGSADALYLEDGQLVNSLSDPNMAEALAYIRQLIADDLVDPEWPANPGLRHQEKAFQGVVGVVYAHWAHMARANFIQQYKAINPDAEWAQLAPPTGPGGQSDGPWDIGAVTLTALSSRLKDDPAKVQKIVDLFNYISTQPGLNLVQYGIEGQHYNMEGERAVQTELGATEGGYFHYYQFTGRDEIPYVTSRFYTEQPYWEFALAQPYTEVLNGFVTPPEGYVHADALRFMDEQMVAFLTGTRSLDEFDAFYQELLTTFNYQAYLDAAAEQLSALGIVQ